jgi:hypothetical protein
MAWAFAVTIVEHDEFATPDAPVRVYLHPPEECPSWSGTCLGTFPTREDAETAFEALMPGFAYDYINWEHETDAFTS